MTPSAPRIHRRLNPLPRSCVLARLVAGALTLIPSLMADEHVAVIASAATAYTQRKFDGPKVRTETYVFMEGSFIPGQTVDRSIERMPFRRIAEFLAPELARRLGWKPMQVDRLFDLHHASRLDQLEAAAKALGKQIDVTLA